MTKVFIDGREGTTGLRIMERMEGRKDIELLSISDELRKDPAERARLINASDITFLCLPDAAAIEAVSLCTNDHTKIIDASTAHRTAEGWAYGYPELSKEHREAVATCNRIANPGCHATGFITAVYPLVKGGIMPADYPVSAFSLTGYSGGGKKMIAQYEGEERDKELDAPRSYAVSQKHKHLKEMKAVCGLTREPLFSPIVADYYSGMLVTVPLYTDLLAKKMTPAELQEYFAEYFKGEPFIKVREFGAEEASSSFLSGNTLSGRDDLEIFITGNEERILVNVRFDNLGKGASAAAVECMNIALGLDPTTGLCLGQ